jgi:phenylacetic acid degradation operon negative regulatory protein
MHARSALFDVYGDHLRGRGSVAPVAGLVRLLEPVGIAAPAVRTAISRMVSQDWLEPVRLPAGRGYRATPRAIRRLDEARARIYRGAGTAWDGRWHLVILTGTTARPARERLRADLSFLGYAELGPHLWVSPFRRTELDDLLASHGAVARHAVAEEIDPSPIDAWDLSALETAYGRWPAEAARLVTTSGAGTDDPDEAAFAARFHLVHEWRKFLFTDPGLPEELLPAGWPGRPAAAVFAEEAERLKPASDRFVARCLD